MIDLGPDSPEIIAAKMTLVEFYGSDWGQGDDSLTDMDKASLDARSKSEKTSPLHKAVNDLNFVCWDVGRKADNSTTKKICQTIKDLLKGTEIMVAARDPSNENNAKLLKPWLLVLKDTSEKIARKYKKYLPDELAVAIQKIFATV